MLLDLRGYFPGRLLTRLREAPAVTAYQKVVVQGYIRFFLTWYIRWGRYIRMPKRLMTFKADDADIERWKKAADALGWNLSEFIRKQVDRFFREPVPDETELRFDANGGHKNLRRASAVPVDRGRTDAPRRIRRAKTAPPRIEPEAHGVSVSAHSDGGVTADDRMMCGHDYGPHACPFPNCPNYKWRTA